MSGKYRVPVSDLDYQAARFRDVDRQLGELQMATGTQTAQALAKIRQLIEGIIAQTEVNVSGSVTAGGSVSAGGSGTFPAGINSLGVFNLDVSTLPGTRRTEWVHQSGALGYAPSTVLKKANVDGYGGTAQQFLACMPIVWEYIAQLDIRDNPENPYYDSSYEVPTETGHLAELLIANGLSEFVFTDPDGTPAGINYAEFAAVGFVIVGRAHDQELREIRRRLDDFEAATPSAS